MDYIWWMLGYSEVIKEEPAIKTTTTSLTPNSFPYPEIRESIKALEQVIEQSKQKNDLVTK